MFEAQTSTPSQGDAIQGGATESQDVKQTADVSTSVTSDVNTSPNSSSGEGDKNTQAPTLREKIQEGLDKLTKGPEAKDSPPEAKPQENGQKPPEGQEDPDDPLSAEEKAAPAEVMAHPAVKKILNERKQARRERNRLAKEVEVYKHDAGQHRQIQQFLKQHNVPDSDAAEALKMVALAYTNPKEFYSKLTGMVAQWGEHLGQTLPVDLQKEVDQGLISPERASELAQARAEAKIAGNRAEMATEQVRHSDTQREMQYRTQLFENWAGQISRTDPDLNKKLPMITAKLLEMREREGDPGSPEIAWERLNRAHKEVSEFARQFNPARTVVNPSPASTALPRGAATAPQTYDQAKDSAINRLMSGQLK